MLSREWLQAFVPIGVLIRPDEWVAVGAGVLFVSRDVLWLVTARHVVVDNGKERLAALLHRADGSTVIAPLDVIQKAASFTWIEDEATDLAATPIPTSPGLAIKAVTERECIGLKDVVPCMPSFTVGCPYGVAGLDPSNPSPLVLDGVVSGTRADDVLYTSAPTFPGNSGGPLVVFQSPCQAGGNIIVDRQLLFAGIVLQTLIVPAPSDSTLPLPPVHLGMVRSADAVLRLLASTTAVELAHRLKTTTTRQTQGGGPAIPPAEVSAKKSR